MDVTRTSTTPGCGLRPRGAICLHTAVTCARLSLLPRRLRLSGDSPQWLYETRRYSHLIYTAAPDYVV